MPRRDRSPVEDLRLAIDCLPLRTRVAMLEGVRGNEIIVGAYTDRRGGVCPMLAAHRNGGRTSFVSFARSWDKFAGAKRARSATERELDILETHLESSILADDGGFADLAQAIREHQATARARRAREARETGWAWMRTRRERQDAERALERVEDERQHAGIR